MAFFATEAVNATRLLRNATSVKQRLSDFDCVDVFKRNMTELDTALVLNDKAMRLCRMNITLWNIIPPIYLLVGTVSNVLSIMVWSKRRLAQQTQHVSTMLTWLAVFDLLVLYTGLMKHYLKKSIFRWDLQVSSKPSRSTTTKTFIYASFT